MSGSSNEVEIRVTSRDLTAPAFERAKGRIGELERKMLDLSKQKIQVDANIADVENDLRKLRDELNDPDLKRPRIEVRAEIEGAKRDLEELKVKARTLGREKVKISVETREARMQVAALGETVRKEIGDAKKHALALKLEMKANGEETGRVGSIFRREMGSLSSSLERLPAKARGIGLVVIGMAAAKVAVAAAGAGVAVLGSAIAGLGIKAAAADQSVKDAFTSMADHAKATTKQMAAPFVPVLRGIADLARSTFDGFVPDLTSAFSKMAPAVYRFATDIGKALGELRPAIGPLTDGFVALLASLGPSLQVSLRSISEGLASIGRSVEEHPNALPKLIEDIATMTEGTLKLAAVLNDLRGEEAEQYAVTERGKQILEAHNKALEDQKRAAEQARVPTATLADAHRLLAEEAHAAQVALSEQAHTMLLARGDTESFNTAVLDAADALKRNGKELGMNTRAGIENNRALDNIAATTLSMYDNAVKAHKGTKDLTKIMQDGKHAWLDAAVALGMDAKKAKELADALFNIPKNNNIDIHIRTFGNLDEAERAGRFNDNTSSAGGSGKASKRGGKRGRGKKGPAPQSARRGILGGYGVGKTIGPTYGQPGYSGIEFDDDYVDVSHVDDSRPHPPGWRDPKGHQGHAAGGIHGSGGFWAGEWGP
jgi:hypothetical protein